MPRSPLSAVIDGNGTGQISAASSRSRLSGGSRRPLKLLPAALLAPSKMYPVIALNSGASDAYGRSDPSR
jgi:hypothetical protein